MHKVFLVKLFGTIDNVQFEMLFLSENAPKYILVMRTAVHSAPCYFGYIEFRFRSDNVVTAWKAIVI